MAFDFGWLCKISHTKITNSRRKCSREAVHCNCVAVLSRPIQAIFYVSWDTIVLACCGHAVLTLSFGFIANFRWCLRSSQEHSAWPWIERLASSIFLVAALECPEHLQFAGHCWHKLSENWVLIDEQKYILHVSGASNFYLSRSSRQNSELSQIFRNLRNISICNECSQVFHQSTCLQKLPKSFSLLRLQEESQPFSRNFSKFS